jgi:hypothetical protein
VPLEERKAVEVMKQLLGIADEHEGRRKVATRLGIEAGRKAG